uniref:Uncharacterized protein n=1 Tax=Biomphalaria glabrata TaxID=6526 RepID=A0A2C9LBN2_BIOGL
MTLLSRITKFVICTFMRIIWSSVSVCANEPDKLKDSFQDDLANIAANNLMLGILVSIIIFLLVVIVIIPLCMDCMNSEVSSMNHPACGGSRTDYAVPDAPTQNFSSSSVAGYGGFAGYSTSISDNNSPFHATSGPVNIPYNPEPPPPYEAAYGNRH